MFDHSDGLLVAQSGDAAKVVPALRIRNLLNCVELVVMALKHGVRLELVF